MRYMCVYIAPARHAHPPRTPTTHTHHAHSRCLFGPSYQLSVSRGLSCWFLCGLNCATNGCDRSCEHIPTIPAIPTITLRPLCAYTCHTIVALLMCISLMCGLCGAPCTAVVRAVPHRKAMEQTVQAAAWRQGARGVQGQAVGGQVWPSARGLGAGHADVGVQSTTAACLPLLRNTEQFSRQEASFIYF